ncbi:methionine aminopeptidase 1 [Folsomia candida]|uniref:methionine aminopeptidase 1 n=1 Tax=Folsomia candida TaxID=158441 RepID=UPI000B8FF201|nr:methionine aminopeptidase 1 [Folsomia candida]
MPTLQDTTCCTLSCPNPAKLQCPTCLKQGLEEGSFFCSQDCFRTSWPVHKSAHKKTGAKTVENGSGRSNILGVYDPFENHSVFKYSGGLRAAYPLGVKRAVPPSIPRPDYGLETSDGKPLSEMAIRGSSNIRVLTDEEIEGMRVAGRLSRQVLDAAALAVTPSTTTDTIDAIVHETCLDLECYPSPLNYYGFPKSCCTSVNEVICHGIPDQRKLQEGDICNVDVTVYHRGFHGDLNETLFVGERVGEEARKLVTTTYECLQKSITACKPGTKYRDIGNIIQKHAQSMGFSVVRSYCGHGIHQLFHCAPSVPHYAKNKAIGVMKPGHSFTIEPMINAGSWRDEQWPDDWTAVTVDGKLSAQFEETLVVTETGVEVVTGRASGRPYFMG